MNENLPKRIPKRLDPTVNQRAQRRIQRYRDAGGRAFSMLIDARTNECLKTLMTAGTETQVELVSRLICEAAKKLEKTQKTMQTNKDKLA